MAGTVKWHEPAKRFYVRVWWHGKDERFWNYNGVSLEIVKDRSRLIGQTGYIVKGEKLAGGNDG